jgi:energy-coupling factor transporter transmembrane protein EcfT
MEFLSSPLSINIIGGLITAVIIGFIAKMRRFKPIVIKVPIWLIAFIIAVPIIYYVSTFFKPTFPEQITNRHFHTQRIVADGKNFVKCDFDRCQLIFHGHSPFGLEYCTFTDPNIIFDDNANITLFEIQRLWNDPSWHNYMEHAITGK